MGKINVVCSYRDKDIEIVKVADRFCPEGTVYIMSNALDDILKPSWMQKKSIDVIQDPFKRIKALEKTINDRESRRLDGLRYWQERSYEAESIIRDLTEGALD